VSDAHALTPRRLRAYLERPWKDVRRAKEAFWAQQARAQSATTRLQMSSDLWVHARAVDPRFPRPELRRADLEHHARLAKLLGRIAHVFGGR
jgi:hypothetical protein